MDLSKLVQIQLSSQTIIKPFECAENDLNGFLFEDAKHFQKELMAVTYLLEDVKENLTVAYYSLLADKISFNPDEKSIWNKLNRNIPNQKKNGFNFFTELDREDETRLMFYDLKNFES